MSKIVDYLLKNGLDTLIEKKKLGLNIKLYDDGRTVINYNQIDSPKFNGLVREARGFIIDRFNNYKIIARSFDRFFNLGECPDENKYNIKDAIVYEKIDGSLINVYWYNGKWRVATRKMVDAEGTVGFDGETTFREIFDKCFDINKMNQCDKNTTFIFELVSPETRVVKKYNERKLYLLGARHNIEGWEYNINDLEQVSNKLNIDLPKTYRFNSFESVIQSMKELPPLDEGYVCVWQGYLKSFYRLKIKNPSYLAVAHLRGNGILSEKRIIYLIMENKHIEYLIDFPEDKEIFEKYELAYDKIKSDIDLIWKKTKDIKDQKEFALAVKDFDINGILFRLRKGNSVSEIFEKMTDNYKVELFKQYLKL